MEDKKLNKQFFGDAIDQEAIRKFMNEQTDDREKDDDQCCGSETCKCGKNKCERKGDE